MDNLLLFWSRAERFCWRNEEVRGCKWHLYMPVSALWLSRQHARAHVYGVKCEQMTGDPRHPSSSWRIFPFVLVHQALSNMWAWWESDATLLDIGSLPGPLMVKASHKARKCGFFGGRSKVCIHGLRTSCPKDMTVLLGAFCTQKKTHVYETHDFWADRAGNMCTCALYFDIEPWKLLEKVKKTTESRVL